MPILSDADATHVRQMLAGLPNPVRLVFFTQALNCETCEPTKQLLSELAALSDQLSVEEHSYPLEQDAASAMGIDRVPAIAVIGQQDYGIRFLGIPSGYEFMSLLDAIQVVSSGEAGLGESSMAALAELQDDVRVQVFVTPT